MAKKKKSLAGGKSAARPKPAPRGKLTIGRKPATKTKPERRVRIRLTATAKRDARRVTNFKARLKVVRDYVGGFDSKALDKLYTTKPRTAAGIKKRRSKLAQIASVHSRLRGYVNRPTKRVRPRGKTAPKKLESLREYAGLPKIKGLRAVPVEVLNKKSRVKLDSKNRVTIKHGRASEVMYKFPAAPRNGWVRASDGKRLTAAEAKKLKKGEKLFLTAGEDAIAMLRKMMPKLPRNGQYLIITKMHSLIPWSGDRGRIVQTLIDFVYQYEGKGVAPWLMPQILGVKRVGTSLEGLWNYKKTLKEARSKSQHERIEKRRADHERAAFRAAKQTGKGKRR